MDTREVGQLTTAQVPDQCLRSSGEGVGLSKRIWAPWSVQDSRASWAEELALVTKMAVEGGEQTEKCVCPAEPVCEMVRIVLMRRLRGNQGSKGNWSM